MPETVARASVGPVVIQIIAVALVALVGAAAGWLSRQLPVPPFVRDATAAAVGWIAGLVGSMALTIVLLAWWQQALGSGGLGAVSVGFSETFVLGVPAVVVFATAVPVVLRRSGLVARPMLDRYGPICIGAACALLGALLVGGVVG